MMGGGALHIEGLNKCEQFRVHDVALTNRMAIGCKSLQLAGAFRIGSKVAPNWSQTHSETMPIVPMSCRPSTRGWLWRITSTGNARADAMALSVWSASRASVTIAPRVFNGRSGKDIRIVLLGPRRN